MESIKTNYGEFTDSEDENIVSKENNENIEKKNCFATKTFYQSKPVNPNSDAISVKYGDTDSENEDSNSNENEIIYVDSFPQRLRTM